METDMALESEVVAEEAMEIPEVPPAMIEAQKRRADLERLNTIDEPTRVEIASMDVMGEFGSKVGLLLSVLEGPNSHTQINFLIKHLLWYRIKDKSARHVVFSNWSDSLFSTLPLLQHRKGS